MTTPSQRGRRVGKNSRRTSSLRIFYIAVAGIFIIGTAVLITWAMGQGRGVTPGSPTANVGDLGTSAAESFDGQAGVTTDGFHFKGTPDAPVTVIEYADYQCPACANIVTSSLYEQLNNDYIKTNKIQFIFHDFPLPYHTLTPLAAQAAYCAGDQGKYWEMHDQIFRTQESWTTLQPAAAADRFGSFAREYQLDLAAFQSCISSQKYLRHLQEAGQAAENAGIDATPTFVVEGRKVNAAELLNAIDAALAASGGS